MADSITNKQVQFRTKDSSGNVSRFIPTNRAQDVDISEITKKYDSLSEFLEEFLQNSNNIQVYETYEDYMKDYNAGNCNNQVCIVKETIVTDDDVDETTVEDIISYIKTTNYFDIKEDSLVTDSYTGSLSLSSSEDFISITAGKESYRNGLINLNGFITINDSSISTSNSNYLYDIMYKIGSNIELVESFSFPTGTTGNVYIPIRFSKILSDGDVLSVSIVDKNSNAISGTASYTITANYGFGGK